MAITQFMHSLLLSSEEEKKVLKMFGDGKDRWRDYADVDDVKRAIIKSLRR